VTRREWWETLDGEQRPGVSGVNPHDDTDCPRCVRLKPPVTVTAADEDFLHTVGSSWPAPDPED
jgi:hypothetical protein